MRVVCRWKARSTSFPMVTSCTSASTCSAKGIATMAFDQHLAKRTRAQLSQHVEFVEKKMFGGLAFLVQGNMCCGVHQNTLIVRLDPQSPYAALRRPHTRPFDLSGRPMKGWLLVDAAGLQDDSELAEWIHTAVRYVSSRPAKS